MKNILKRIVIFSIVLLLSISNINCFEIVEAITIHNKNLNIEIYEVKNKDELVINDNLVILYEEGSNNEEFVEYKKDQAKEEMKNYRLEKAKQERIAFKTNIVNFAKRFIGNPYVLGGTSLTNGADCSGFVQSVYSRFGISLPRTTAGQVTVGEAVSIDEIEVGDIVSYGENGFATHSAIYIGNGLIIHASTPELGIRIDNISILPILSIRRVI